VWPPSIHAGRMRRQCFGEFGQQGLAGRSRLSWARPHVPLVDDPDREGSPERVGCPVPLPSPVSLCRQTIDTAERPRTDTAMTLTRETDRFTDLPRSAVIPPLK
jgi:hypothetical protein